MDDMEQVYQSIARAKRKIEEAMYLLAAELGPDWAVGVNVVPVDMSTMSERRYSWRAHIEARLNTENIR